MKRRVARLARVLAQTSSPLAIASKGEHSGYTGLIALAFVTLTSCSTGGQDLQLTIEDRAMVVIPGCGPGSARWRDDVVENPDLDTMVPDRPITGSAPAISAEPTKVLESTFKVEQGVATYKASLFVPPGRAGMQPDLSVSYNSSAANGVMGVGWGISANSAIHRCAATLARDGFARPVRYDDDDKLCLNGQRLMLHSGSYGSPGAEYRTEIESWMKVEQRGDLASAAACFTVTMRDGKVATYGGCSDPDAVEVLSGATAPWAWKLDTLVDPAENAIDYDYTTILDEHVLDAIRYTAHPSLPANREVRFHYRERTEDITRHFVIGSEHRSRVLLDEVVMMAKGEMARGYKFEYSPSEGTRRNLLRRITECAAPANLSQERCACGEYPDISCDPTQSGVPTTFSYSEEAPRFAARQLDSDLAKRYRQGSDYDGDGSRDWFVDVHAREQNIGIPANTVLRLSTGPEVGISAWDRFAFDHDVDIDSDGRVDIGGVVDGELAFASYDSSVTAFETLTTNVEIEKDGDLEGIYHFNDDGKPDVLTKEVTTGRITLWTQCDPGLSAGSGGCSCATQSDNDLAFCPDQQFTDLPPCLNIDVVGDINGDGVADVLLGERDPSICAPNDLECQQQYPTSCPGEHDRWLLSDPSSTGSPKHDVIPSSALNLPQSSSEGFELVDLNEDGLPDLLSYSGGQCWPAGGASQWRRRGLPEFWGAPYDGNYSCTQGSSTVRLNTGGSFAPGASAGRGFIAADVDQDGRTELLRRGDLAPEDEGGKFCFTNFVDVNPEQTVTKYCTDAYVDEQELDLSSSFPQFDRSFYQWEVVELDFDASGAITPRYVPAPGLVAPKNGLRIANNPSGDGRLAGLVTTDRVWRISGGTPPYEHYQIAGHYGGAYAPYGVGHGTFVLDDEADAGDRLVEIDNGLGLRRRIDYQALADDPAPGCPGSLYAGTPSSLNKPGRKLVDTSLTVVARVDVSDGFGGENGTCYQYETGWVDTQGRGFQGFSKIHVTTDTPGDAVSDLTTTTKYSTVFPTARRAFERLTWIRGENPNEVFPIENEYSWSQQSCMAGVCQVRPWKEIRNFRDLSPALRAVDSVDRAKISDTSTEYIYLPGKDEMYSNATEIVTRRRDKQLGTNRPLRSYEQRVRNYYSYNFESDWWIDKLDSKTVTEKETVYHNGTPPQLLSETNQDKIIITEFEYFVNDHRRRLVKRESIQPGVPTQELTKIYDYDTYRNPTKESATGSRSPRTRTSEVLEYDSDQVFPTKFANAASHITTIATDARTGLPTRSTDPNGLIAETDYDGFGRVLEHRQFGREGRLSERPAYTRVEPCDANAQNCPAIAGVTPVLRTTVSKSGHPRQYRFVDALGRVVLEAVDEPSGSHIVNRIDYDRRGRVTTRWAPQKADWATTTFPTDATLGAVEFSDFDARGRARHVTRSQPDLDAPADSVTYEFEFEGYTTRELVNGTVERTQTTDSMGRLVESIDAMGQSTKLYYDPTGKIGVVVDAFGNETLSIYDALGRQTSYNGLNADQHRLYYNGFGEITERVIPESSAVYTYSRFEYDVLGRKVAELVGTAEWSPDLDADVFDTPTLEAQWTYDSPWLGALASEEGGTGGYTAFCRGFEYDDAGRLRRTLTKTGGESFVVHNAYDENYGFLKSTTYPNDIKTVGYARSPDGHLLGEYDAETGFEYRMVAEYDVLGNVSREQFGDGAFEGRYAYSPSAGVATSLWVGVEDTSVQHLTYKYDHARTMLSRRTDHVSGVEETFDYDQLNRVVTSTRGQVGSGQTEVISYAYDELGNITRKSDYASSYTYGTAQRAGPSFAGPHAVAAYTGINGLSGGSFVYDARGNRISGDGGNVVYDHYNKPVKITRSPASGLDEVDFKYGPERARYLRIDRLDGDEVERTYRVGDLYELERKAGEQDTHRLYIGDKVIAEWTEGSEEVVYRHPDRLGSTSVTTNEDGNPVEHVGFGPFGAPRDEDWNTNANGFQSRYGDRGFTGHEQLDNVRLTHMGGRVYDYQLGRFLSVDPFAELGDLQSHNSYSYVRNNAINRIDPSGYQDVGTINVDLKLDPLNVSQALSETSIEGSGFDPISIAGFTTTTTTVTASGVVVRAHSARLGDLTSVHVSDLNRHARQALGSGALGDERGFRGPLSPRARVEGGALGTVGAVGTLGIGVPMASALVGAVLEVGALSSTAYMAVVRLASVGRGVGGLLVPEAAVPAVAGGSLIGNAWAAVKGVARYNPTGRAELNCSQCVAALFDNIVNGGFVGPASRYRVHVQSLRTPKLVLDFVTRETGATFSRSQGPIAKEGYYAIFNRINDLGHPEHVLFAHAKRHNGKLNTIFYDPQIGKRVSQAAVGLYHAYRAALPD